MATTGLNPDKIPRQIVVNKYLKCFPKPLLEDLVNGRWLPIVGAGMSKNAVLASGETMPLWKELGEKLAEEIPHFEYESPIDAISAFDYEFRRPRLIEKMHELLHIDEAAPGDAHQAFCDLPFDIVSTTNFDFLLERRYEHASQPCTPIVNEDQLSVNLHDTSVALLKIHGDLNHPNRMIATEEDYDAFLERFPVLATYLANLLITRTPVLVGYSLGDPDLRQLWQVVGDRLGTSRRLAYALCVGASPAEMARFERRGVKALNLSSSKRNAGEVLFETFQELKQYWMENIIAESQVKEEEQLRELRLPVDFATRLCLFVLPFSAQAFYRENVFPNVRDVGLVPVTPDDVISPGRNVFATIESLIGRASLVVIDASSKFTMAEARRLFAYERSVKLVVVIQEGASIPFDLAELHLLRRPDLTSVDMESFLKGFVARIKDTFNELAPQLDEERHRLLDSKEYRAAVISAITHLETALRRRLDVIERNDRGFVSVTNMINIAKRRELLGKFAVDQVLQWIELRNQVVHSKFTVSQAMAKRIVHGVDEITRELLR